jgi:hypothetical protein
MPSGQHPSAPKPLALPLLLIPLAAFLAILPLLLKGGSCGHDMVFHVQGWFDAAAQLRHFHYPRWSFTSAWNAGEPRFIFYPPLSWLLGALLTLIFPPNAVVPAFIFLALTAAGLSFYKLASEFTTPAAALVAAAFYLANPYMLFNAFERCAFAELLASAWIPLLLLAVLRRRPTIPSIAIPLALLWLTNAPAAVMGSYTLALLATLRVIQSLLQHRKSSAPNSPIPYPLSPRLIPNPYSLIPVFLLGTLLGLTLPAFYLIPAAYERRFIQIAMAIIPTMRVQDNFLFTHTQDSGHNGVNLQISLLAITLLALTLLAIAALWIVHFRARKASARASAASAASSAAASPTNALTARAGDIGPPSPAIALTARVGDIGTPSPAIALTARVGDIGTPSPAIALTARVGDIGTPSPAIALTARVAHPWQSLILPWVGDIETPSPTIAITVLTAAIILMLLPISTPIWNHLPELQYLQFPWRLMTLLSAVLGLTLAILFNRIPPRTPFLFPISYFLLPALLGFTAFHLYAQFCQPTDPPPAIAQQIARHQGFPPTDEYTPNNADSDVLRTTNPAYWLLPAGANPNTPAPNTQPTAVELDPSIDTDDTVVPLPQRISTPAPTHFDVMPHEPALLVLNLRDYPNWEVSTSDECSEERYQHVHIARDDGLIAIPLYCGALHTTDITWRTTLDQKLGVILSISALLILVWLSFRTPPDPTQNKVPPKTEVQT